MEFRFYCCHHTLSPTGTGPRRPARYSHYQTHTHTQLAPSHTCQHTRINADTAAAAATTTTATHICACSTGMYTQSTNSRARIRFEPDAMNTRTHSTLSQLESMVLEINPLRSRAPHAVRTHHTTPSQLKNRTNVTQHSRKSGALAGAHPTGPGHKQ